MPGLGPTLASRLLAEIGDDTGRFESANGLRAFAGTAPITRASGRYRAVSARRIAAVGLVRVIESMLETTAQLERAMHESLAAHPMQPSAISPTGSSDASGGAPALGPLTTRTRAGRQLPAS
jgi:transposase